MTAGTGSGAPGGNGEDAGAHRIIVTFPPVVGAEPSIDFGQTTTAELYAAVYLLDMVAHELRQALMAQRLQERAAAGLQVVRSMPGIGGARRD